MRAHLPSRIRSDYGFGEILANRPAFSCVGPINPAVIYRVSGGAFIAVAPAGPLNVTVQRPGLTMGLPLASDRVPINSVVTGSNALIFPSPKFPTRMSLANCPKSAGASPTPHGEFSSPR